MNNPRITAKERGLIKGACRRVFARSELRKQIVDGSVIKGYVDRTRPKVKTWCRCKICRQPTPKSYVKVDHILPVISVDSAMTEMSWDDLINALWCDVFNLQALCENCHDEKTSKENYERRLRRKMK